MSEQHLFESGSGADRDGPQRGQSLTGALSAIFSTGLRVAITLVIIFYLGKIVIGLINDFSLIFGIEDFWLRFLFCFLLVFGLGTLLYLTPIIRWLRNWFGGSALIQKFLSILPDRETARSLSAENRVIAWYHFSPTLCLLGEVTNRLEQNGRICYVFHFQSPPVPKTGHWVKPIWEDDPNLEWVHPEFTLADYAVYIATSGRSLSARDLPKKKYVSPV